MLDLVLRPTADSVWESVQSALLVMAKVERQCGGFNLLEDNELSGRVVEAVHTALKDKE